MTMKLRTRTFLVAIWFILGVRGKLEMKILDVTTVEVGANVVVTCQDLSKSKPIRFAYKADGGNYTDIATCSRLQSAFCTVPNPTKYSASKDIDSNAMFAEFNLTLKSFSDSFYGYYQCLENVLDGNASTPVKIPDTVDLGKPCSDIMRCRVAHSHCKPRPDRTCACDLYYFQFENYCSAATTTTIPNSTAEQTTPSQSAATNMTEASNTTEAVKANESSRTSTASSSTISSSFYKPPNEYDFVIALIIGITIGVPLLLIIPVIALVVYRYRIRNIQKAKVYKSAQHAFSKHHEHGGNGQANKAYYRHSDHRHGSEVGAEHYVHQPSQQMGRVHPTGTYGVPDNFDNRLQY